MAMTTTVDVTVIGGGIVGLAAALQAVHDGFSVALLTPSGWQPWSSPSDWQSEVSALSPSSLAFLAQLGLTEVLRPRACCFYAMQVYAAPTGGASEKEKFALAFHDPEGQALGAIVENQTLAAALAAAVLPRVQQYHEPLRQLERRDSCFRLRWENASLGTLDTRLLLAADGVHSTWRQRFGIPVQKTDYQQTALTAVLMTAASHRQTAWQVFLPGGPLALLPLADKVMVMVWSLPTAEAERYQAAPKDLVAAVNRYWAEQFGGHLVLASPVQATPLLALHADYYAQGRFALLGDAAHRVHPLAGQGLNLSLRDLAVLSALWQQATDPGDYRFLRRFERWRHLENDWLLKSFSLINQVFCQEQLPFRYASALGMAGINYLPVKHWLQRIAQGQSLYSDALLSGIIKKQEKSLCI
jgi:ubiquinone biosynthesis UbiH/UbiF/VisC/COQ6 family hydroxylase